MSPWSLPGAGDEGGGRPAQPYSSSEHGKKAGPGFPAAEVGLENGQRGVAVFIPRPERKALDL